jgi:hypothetical protein
MKMINLFFKKLWFAALLFVGVGLVDPAHAAGMTGLNNNGNTCYQNALLQAMFGCESFRALVNNILRENADLESPIVVPPPLEALQETFTNLARGDGGVFNPRRFAQCVWNIRVNGAAQEDGSVPVETPFKRLAQEDSDQLFMTLANMFDETLNRPLKLGLGLRDVNRQSCVRDHAKVKEDAWGIPKMELNFPAGSSKSQFTIEELLASRVSNREEYKVLPRRPNGQDQNGFVCEICEAEDLRDGNRDNIFGKYNGADRYRYDGTKISSIVLDPREQFLVIQIKRFIENYDHYPNITFDKRAEPVICPTGRFSFQDNLGATHTFQIVSVVIHAGSSLAGGHYYAVTTQGCFNDSTVTPGAGELPKLLRDGHYAKGGWDGHGYIYFCRRVGYEPGAVSFEEKYLPGEPENLPGLPVAVDPLDGAAARPVDDIDEQAMSNKIKAAWRRKKARDRVRQSKADKIAKAQELEAARKAAEEAIVAQQLEAGQSTSTGDDVEPELPEDVEPVKIVEEGDSEDESDDESTINPEVVQKPKRLSLGDKKRLAAQRQKKDFAREAKGIKDKRNSLIMSLDLSIDDFYAGLRKDLMSLLPQETMKDAIVEDAKSQISGKNNILVIIDLRHQHLKKTIELLRSSKDARLVKQYVARAQALFDEQNLRAEIYKASKMFSSDLRAKLVQVLSTRMASVKNRIQKRLADLVAFRWLNTELQPNAEFSKESPVDNAALRAKIKQLQEGASKKLPVPNQVSEKDDPLPLPDDVSTVLRPAVSPAAVVHAVPVPQQRKVAVLSGPLQDLTVATPVAKPAVVVVPQSKRMLDLRTKWAAVKEAKIPLWQRVRKFLEMDSVDKNVLKELTLDEAQGIFGENLSEIAKIKASIFSGPVQSKFRDLLALLTPAMSVVVAAAKFDDAASVDDASSVSMGGSSVVSDASATTKPLSTGVKLPGLPVPVKTSVVVRNNSLDPVLMNNPPVAATLTADELFIVEELRKAFSDEKAKPASIWSKLLDAKQNPKFKEALERVYGSRAWTHLREQLEYIRSKLPARGFITSDKAAYDKVQAILVN